MKLIAVLIIFVAYINPLHAQQDYIITIKGDTVFGEGKVINDMYVKFKTGDETKFKEVNAGEIKEIYLSKNKMAYVYKIINPTQPSILFKKLEDGTITLYELKRPAWGNSYNVTWYAEKNGRDFKEIKNNGMGGNSDSHKQRLIHFISDQPTLVEEFNKESKYSIQFISKLVNQYNAMGGTVSSK